MKKSEWCLLTIKKFLFQIRWEENDSYSGDGIEGVTPNYDIGDKYSWEELDWYCSKPNLFVYDEDYKNLYLAVPAWLAKTLTFPYTAIENKVLSSRQKKWERAYHIDD